MYGLGSQFNRCKPRKNAALRRQMGKAAREWGREHFDERDVHRIVKAEYARLLNDRGLGCV